MPDLADEPALPRLVGFGRYLRSLGLPVGTGRVMTFCRAAGVLDPFDRTDLRLAARASLALVGVQQRLVGPAAQHPGELPPEVVDRTRELYLSAYKQMTTRDLFFKEEERSRWLG